MTSREAALVAFGPEAIRHYEEVKAFYTRLGSAFERSFAAAVGGRVGHRGEADVITRLGEFEFCAAANTKNASGNAAQLARVGAGRVVQVTGAPARGRISGIDFLRMHGVRNAERVAGECEVAALSDARRSSVRDADEQLDFLGVGGRGDPAPTQDSPPSRPRRADG